MTITKVLLSMFMGFALAACAAPQVWESKTGQVLDWDTKEPVPNAYVVFVWMGKIPVIADFMMTCYHVESATTDNGGRFKIPS